MLHGLHGMSSITTLLMSCPQPRKPAKGCVAPQMLTTGVPTSDARCMLELSIDIITSRWLISISSLEKPFSRAEAFSSLPFLLIHSSMTAVSFLPPPNRNILPSGYFSDRMLSTSSIFSFGYILPLCAANGATPIQISSFCLLWNVSGSDDSSPPPSWNMDLNSVLIGYPSFSNTSA